MSGFLLDTCTFLWAVWAPEKLSSNAHDIYRDPSNAVFLSSASTWEIAIKVGLGNLDMPAGLNLITEIREDHKIVPLPIDEESTLRIGTLPEIHSDPFDRILVSQAITNGLTLLTPDQTILKYPAKTYW